MIYSRTLLFIHPLCSSLHLQIPNSQSTPPSLPLSASGLFSESVSLIKSLVSASLVAQTVKRLPTMQETLVQSLGQEDLLEKEVASHSRVLTGCRPWGHRESDTTEWLPLHFSVSLYAYTTSSSSTQLLMNTAVVSMSWLLSIVLLWMSGCVYLFEITVFFGYVPRNGVSGSHDNSDF